MTRRLIAPALALAALASAQAAQAQQQACVAPADVSDAAIYAMPIIFDAARTTCANRLARNGFIATGGEAFVAPFRAGQDKAWPGAYRLIKVFMAQKGAGEEAGGVDIGQMLGGMPESTVRPFVDGLLGQMIAEEIKPADCGKIERAMELNSPLPRENVGGLVAFLIEIAKLDNPPVCGAAQPPRAAK
ncbi:hypothetical protein ACLBKU_09445 [Erythrobacter sp. NE805]|uniref:hypothetical protein n=1 Tax=Erythrobacter sp. NE805 TaxID=3389875 RepID=UPI00396AF71C